MASEDSVWHRYFELRAKSPARPLLIRTLELMADAGRQPGQAIDLGCGEGTDTAELLSRGWQVLAIDGSAEGIARTRARAEELGWSSALEARCARFEELDVLPPADLLFASVSLPFCPPEHFDTLWSRIRQAVQRRRGWLSVELLGPNDSWAGSPRMTVHDRAGVEQLFTGVEIRDLAEMDEDGKSASGPKHWHLFKVIAAAA